MSVEELARLLHQSLGLVDPPRTLTRKAIGAFARGSLGDALRSAVRVVAASLTFDSQVACRLAIGMRSAGGGAVHRGLYRLTLRLTNAVIELPAITIR